MISMNLILLQKHGQKLMLKILHKEDHRWYEKDNY